MTSKRITPYQRLMEDVQRLARQVAWPARRLMTVFPKDGLTNGYRIDGVAERVQAADQLGYDVRLKWNPNSGLVAEYVKRPDDPERFL